MSVAIRDAVPDDAPGIALVHVEGWQTTYRGLLPDAFLDGLNVEQRTTYWRGPIASKPEGWHLLVAESDGAVVGFGCAGVAGGEPSTGCEGGINALYVRPTHRSMKIGEKLLAALFDRLKRDGRKSAALWVLVGNDRAEAFYRRAGARELMRADRPGAGGSLPEIAMGWDESGMAALIAKAA